jgi:1,4-alpha-glucan branching enzyme
VQVTFLLGFDYGAEPVSVVGDFNEWDPTATPLQRLPAGVQAATVWLAPGRRYRFRYRRADGTWFDDRTADGCEPNGLGGTNGVLDLSR